MSFIQIDVAEDVTVLSIREKMVRHEVNCPIPPSSLLCIVTTKGLVLFQIKLLIGVAWYKTLVIFAEISF